MRALSIEKYSTGFYDLSGKFVENSGSYTMEITDLVTLSWTEFECYW